MRKEAANGATGSKGRRQRSSESAMGRRQGWSASEEVEAEGCGQQSDGARRE